MDHYLKTIACISAFIKGGCDEVYKQTIMEKEAAKEVLKKEKGREIDYLPFEASYIGAKICQLSKVLQSDGLMHNKENIETIANELIKLAEELKALED